MSMFISGIDTNKTQKTIKEPIIDGLGLIRCLKNILLVKNV